MDASRSADLTVSAADISRNFGEWQAKAMSEPVMITHHGRPRLVLSSLEIFESRTAPDANKAVLQRYSESEWRSALLNQLRDSVLTLDAELRVIELNPAAELFLGVPRATLIGHDLRDLVPQTRRSVAWDHFGRVLRTGAPIEFQTRSAIGRQPTLRFQAFPCGENNVGVIISNLGAAEEAAVFARRVGAVQNALGADGSMSVIRLGNRGGVESVDKSFTAMTGFTEHQALTLQFADLLALADRTAFNRAMNAAMRDGEGKALNVVLVPRSGDDLSLRVYLGVSAEDAAPDEIIVTLIDVAKLNRAAKSA